MQSICWCIQWERIWYVLPSWGRNWKGVSLVIYAKKPIFSTTPWTSVFPRIGCASTSTWHDFVQHCSECMWKGRRVEGGIGTSGRDGRLQSWGQKIMNLLWPSLHSCKHWSHQANRFSSEMMIRNCQDVFFFRIFAALHVIAHVSYNHIYICIARVRLRCVLSC